jgi:hypothetical protein
VLNERTSLYHAGVRSPTWLNFKPKLSLDVVVTGGSAERIRWSDWGEAVMLELRYTASATVPPPTRGWSASFTAPSPPCTMTVSTPAPSASRRGRSASPAAAVARDSTWTPRRRSALCLRFQRGCGVRAWGPDGLGTGGGREGARGRGGR